MSETAQPTAKKRTRKPLNADQQALAEKYLPLARSLAKPYKLGWPECRDEFESAACLALVQAAEAFNPARGVKFTTYARHRIWGALRDVQRGMVLLGWRGDLQHAPHVGGLPNDPEEKGRALAISRDPPVGSELESKEAVQAILAKLPARHRAILQAVYVEGKPQRDVAAIEGCSQSRLSHICREAISMLDGSFDAKILSECTPPDKGTLMLILRRKDGQWIEITHKSGDVLRFRVYDVSGDSPGRVNLAFDDADRNFAIQRPERAPNGSKLAKA